MDKFNSRKPYYQDDSDYTTNAPSYYDDLARKQKLIQLLAEKIWEYEKTLNGKLELIDFKIGEGFNQEINKLLVKWIEDGTLDHIINVTLMNKKADKVYVENEFSEIRSRLSDISVNVKTFGAKGDGVTDDTLAVESAIKYIKDHGGKMDLLFPPGNYLIGIVKTTSDGFRYAIDIPDNIRLLGEHATIIGDKLRDPYTMFQIRHRKNVTIEGFTFDGVDYKNQVGMTTAVMLRGKLDESSPVTENILLRNLKGFNIPDTFIRGQGKGLDSWAVPSFKKIYVENCIAYNIGGHGIVINNGHDLFIKNNHLERCGIVASYGGLGIDVSGGHNKVVLNGNIIVNCYGGFKAEAYYNDATSFHSKHITITNNIVIGGSISEIYGLRMVSSNAIIDGNIIIGWKTYGINIYTDSDVKDAVDKVIFSNNIVGDIAGHPFRIYTNFVHGAPLVKDKTLFTDNLFYNCSDYGYVISGGVSFINNIFDGFPSYVIRIRNDQSGSHRLNNITIDGNKFHNSVGVRVEKATDDTGSDQLTIINNKFTKCKGGAIAIKAGKNVIVSENLIEMIDNNIGISCENIRNVNINGNNIVVSSSAIGIFIAISDIFVILGNVIKGGVHAIQVKSTLTKGLVSNNIETGSTGGFSLDEKVTGNSNI